MLRKRNVQNLFSYTTLGGGVNWENVWSIFYSAESRIIRWLQIRSHNSTSFKRCHSCFPPSSSSRLPKQDSDHSVISARLKLCVVIRCWAKKVPLLFVGVQSQFCRIALFFTCLIFALQNLQHSGPKTLQKHCLNVYLWW